MKRVEADPQLYASISRNKSHRGEKLLKLHPSLSLPKASSRSKTQLILLWAIPFVLLHLGAWGCGSGIGLFSGPGAGATGNTPEDRRSDGSSSSDSSVGNPGAGDSGGDSPSLTGGRDSTSSTELSGGSDGGTFTISNQGQRVAGGQNWVGIGDDGHVLVKPWMYAVVIPPSGSSDPLGCLNKGAVGQNFGGSLPAVVVGFGSSAQGPWDHFEKFPLDNSCGSLGIHCHYWIYENRGGNLGVQKMKIETDFVRLQAFYTAKPGDLFYPYMNPVPEIPDPFNLGLNPEKPDLSGKYQSDIATIDCKQLVQQMENGELSSEHIESLALKKSEPTMQMLMNPR